VSRTPRPAESIVRSMRLPRPIQCRTTSVSMESGGRRPPPRTRGRFGAEHHLARGASGAFRWRFQSGLSFSNSSARRTKPVERYRRGVPKGSTRRPRVADGHTPSLCSPNGPRLLLEHPACFVLLALSRRPRRYTTESEVASRKKCMNSLRQASVRIPTYEGERRPDRRSREVLQSIPQSSRNWIPRKTIPLFARNSGKGRVSQDENRERFEDCSQGTVVTGVEVRGPRLTSSPLCSVGRRARRRRVQHRYRAGHAHREISNDPGKLALD